jgi:hypothetical protein
MLAMAYSPQKIKLFDVTGWNEIATLEAPDPKMLSRMHFSRDGSQLAAVSGNHVIQLWDLPLIREKLATMRLDWSPLSIPKTRTGSN